MRDSLFIIEPKSLLATRAVGELSKFQPPISRDLRTSMVAWALEMVLGGSPAGHEDAGGQGLWQEGEEGLHRMLLAFLREDPSAGNFFTLLDRVGEKMVENGGLFGGREAEASLAGRNGCISISRTTQTNLLRL
ncbi:UNVERIFIED_CONTAM: hypothetical protein K2H54_050838 [Gekko kuhli]